MPTLRELAEKKTPPGPDGRTASGGSLVILSGGTATSKGAVGSRPAPPEVQSVPGPLERLLGTENRSDVIPMFPPRGESPEKAWESAALLPAGSLGMILGSTMQTGWLALFRPGMPPLLLTPFPILGRLSAEPLELDSSPSATSLGGEGKQSADQMSQSATAPNAG